jgi:hypothetical protein
MGLAKDDFSVVFDVLAQMSGVDRENLASSAKKRGQ